MPSALSIELTPWPTHMFSSPLLICLALTLFLCIHLVGLSHHLPTTVAPSLIRSASTLVKLFVPLSISIDISHKWSLLSLVVYRPLHVHICIQASLSHKHRYIVLTHTHHLSPFLPFSPSLSPSLSPSQTHAQGGVHVRRGEVHARTPSLIHTHGYMGGANFYNKRLATWYYDACRKAF
jgi:hypothetical protein